MAINCASCGYENRADARFCGGCGAALALAPSSAAAAGDRSAPRSYTPAHLAQKILKSRSAIEGERKQVTVLFCDLAGSTELARRLGAEAMHELLNGFFELALAEVHAVEGTINQFLGDGFMALFGAPLAHEDHSLRALTAALAIRDRLGAAGAAGGPLHQASVRMGLNTGMVVVGGIGDNLRMDYTAVGDTTNVAARLQALARPGEICVSDSVQRAGAAHFELADHGRHALKGIAEPAAVHLLKGRRQAAGLDTAGGGIGAPMVGRAAELGLCKAALSDLLGGRGGLLIITGEPGTGKSRLMAEWRRTALPEGLPLPRWLEGRALSFGRKLSYGPFVAMLKSHCGIAEDDGEPQAWPKLVAGVGEEAAPYLASLLALRVPSPYDERTRYLDGPGLKRQVLLSMRQWVERLAAEAPRVLLLEDWHWADPSSIELAEHLLPMTRAHRLLMVLATRPEPAEPAARLRAAQAEIDGLVLRECRLPALSPDSSGALLDALVGAGTLPGALRERILRRTEGNPFFIEEVIRSLVGQGALVRAGREARAHAAPWVLAERIDRIELPETLQGLILARIDRLDDAEKQALKLASVIGRSFFDRVLAAISRAEAELPARLAALEATELIRDTTRAPEPEHMFKHALVQEAAYGSMLAEARRSVHAEVAQAIETLFADRLDEFTPVLAHHFTAAEDWARAQHYLFRAGDQAGRLASDTEALDHLRAAEQAYLKAHGDQLKPLERAALARKLGAALYGTGQYEAAHAQMRAALGHLGIHYPGSRAGVLRHIVATLGRHLLRRGRRAIGLTPRRDIDEARAVEAAGIVHMLSWMDYFLDKERMLLDSLLELRVGERSPHALAEARGLSSLAFGCMTFGLRGLSRRIHAEALRVAEASGHPSAIAFAWFTLGFLDFYEGRWDDCLERMGRAVALYRETGELHRQSAVVLMLAFVQFHRGDLGAVRSSCGALVRDGQDAADPQMESWGLQQLGFVGLACGPLDEAAAGLRKGIEIAGRIPAWDNLVYQQSLLAKVLVLQGRLDEAQSVVEAGQRVVAQQKMKLAFDVIEFRTAEATVALARAEAGTLAATAALKVAEATAEVSRTMPLWRPQALRLLGSASWIAGHPAAARRHWDQSLALAESAGFPLEAALTLAERGRQLGDAAAVDQALVTFRRHGARSHEAFALAALARLAAPVGSAEAWREAAAALGEVKAEAAHVQAHRQLAALPGGSAQTQQWVRRGDDRNPARQPQRAEL